MWEIESTNEFDEWLAEQGEGVVAAVLTKLEALRLAGPHLKRPHADTLNGSKHANMKELRADADGSVVRAAFAFDPNRCAIVLCAGDKAGVSEKRFYARFIERADRLYDEHLDRLAKEK